MTRKFVQRNTNVVCELSDVWDKSAYQTLTITPSSAHSVLLTWAEPDAIDGGPSLALSRILSAGLITLGPIAFRARGAPPECTRLIERIKGHGGGWMAVSAPTSDAAVSLFSEGWDHGDQVAVIGADDERAFAILSAVDLRSLTLINGEWLWCAAVDGDGGILAAATAESLDFGVCSIVKGLSNGYFIEA